MLLSLFQLSELSSASALAFLSASSLAFASAASSSGVGWLTPSFVVYDSYDACLHDSNASCACTIAVVFKVKACSSDARFKHKNGTCRNVETELNPKQLSKEISITTGLNGLSPNASSTHASASSKLTLRLSSG